MPSTLRPVTITLLAKKVRKGICVTAWWKLSQRMGLGIHRGGCSHTSPSSFSEVDSIQKKGVITTASSSQISAVARTRCRRRCPLLLRHQGKACARAGRVITAISLPLCSQAFVVDPQRRGAEDEQRHQQDDDEDQPRQRRGIAHFEVLEGVVVQVQPVEEASVVRAAL